MVAELYSIVFFFFQAVDGIRDLVRSRGLGDVYSRQHFGQTFVERQNCLGLVPGRLNFRFQLENIFRHTASLTQDNEK